MRRTNKRHTSVLQTPLTHIYGIVTFMLIAFGCSNKDKAIYNEQSNSTVVSQTNNPRDLESVIRELEPPSIEEIKAVGDSLAKIDGNRIIGDIHFQMSKNDYNAALKKLMENYNGNFAIICTDDAKHQSPYNEFVVDSIVPSFYQGKLYELKFYGQLEEITKDTNWNDRIYKSYKALIAKFINKYGKPHKVIFDDQLESYVHPICSANWNFEHRAIIIIGQTKELVSNGKTIWRAEPNRLIISDPTIQKRAYIKIDELIKESNKIIEEYENKKQKQIDQQQSL